MSKAMVLAGQLKPEARLGLALSEFAQALDDNARTKFRNIQTSRSVAPIAVSDVLKFTEELNRKGARLHRGWRPAGTRLNLFLGRIQAFASIGDVLVGATQNMIVSGVWAAVRLSLEAAIGFFSYFDKLSTLFMRLGTSWSLHKDFALLFPQCDELQHFLYEYLISLVQLCTKMVLFGKKSIAKQWASSILTSFDAEFSPLRTEIEQWGKLIEQKANEQAARFMKDSESAAVARNRSLVQLISKESKNQRIASRKQQFLQHLSPDQGDFETLWRRQRRKGTCRWIFEKADYKTWRESRQSTALWISGNLGSGKTVILANVVADIYLQRSCSYFFCTAKDPRSVKSSSLIRSILYQILDDMSPEDALWDKLAPPDGSRPKGIDPQSITDIVLSGIARDRKYYVVVDGLDECEREDTEEILEFLQRLSKSIPMSLCLSSRPASSLQKFASNLFKLEHVINLGDHSREDEIVSFIDAEIHRRKGSRNIPPDLEELIKKQLIAGAQGMYLWVALQLDAIFPTLAQQVPSDADVINLLTNLPGSLPEAFDVALKRVVDKSHGDRIFKLVTASARPLTVDELRVALTVIPGDRAWSPSRLPSDGAMLVALCGGNLLEVDEEDQRVRFIHHSVLLHFTSDDPQGSSSIFRFTEDEAGKDMGSVCVTYLNYGIWDTRLSTHRTIDGVQAARRVAEATASANPAMNKVAKHLLGLRRHSKSSYELNITRLTQSLALLSANKDDIAKCFFGYAAEHWLLHTRHFRVDMDDQAVWSFFMMLLEGEIQSVKTPWDANSEISDQIDWAVRNAHCAILHLLLQAEDVPTIPTLRSMFNHFTERQMTFHIGPQYLGDFLAQCFDAQTCQYWDTKTLNLLLDIGVDPTVPHRRTGIPPLPYAAKQMAPELSLRNIEILQRLAEIPQARPTVQGEWMPDILCDLINAQWVEAFDVILRLDPQVNPQPDNWRNPLACAVDCGSLHMVKQLLHAGADTTNAYYTGVHAVELAFNQEREDILALIASPSNLNMRTHPRPTLLYQAVSKRKKSMALLLLLHGADPKQRASEYTYHYPLEAALRWKEKSVVDEIIRRGGEVRACRQLPSFEDVLEIRSLPVIEQYIFLSSEGDPRIAFQPPGRLLAKALALYADVVENEGWPKYTWTPECQIVDLLRGYVSKHDQNVTINIPLEGGNRAIHFACLWDCQTTELLLEQGADPRVYNELGETPLHWAVRQRKLGAWGLIKSLLDYGADPESVTNLGANVLDVWSKNLPPAERRFEADELRLLLSAGADPHARFSDGNTLLRRAIQAYRPKLVHVLVQHKAPTVAILSDSITPLKPALAWFILTGNATAVSKEVLGVDEDDKFKTAASFTRPKPLDMAFIHFHLRGENKKLLDAILRNDGFQQRFFFLDDGEPALSYALKAGWPESATLLLREGADPEVEIDVPSGRQHGLCYAIRWSWTSVAFEMLDQGVNPHVTDIDGKTALEMALLKWYHEENAFRGKTEGEYEREIAELYTIWSFLVVQLISRKVIVRVAEVTLKDDDETETCLIEWVKGHGIEFSSEVS